MNILVTGGAGFIGSHIVDQCIQDGHTVTVVDDLSFGKKTNINSKAHFVKCDIRSDQIEEIITSEHFDVVYHTAAQKSVRNSFAEPLFDADINVMGSIRVLEACKNGGVNTVIFLSTGGTIYGDADIYPTPETEPPQPPSPYTASKLAVEIYLDYYARQFGIKTISLRLANVYGPRQDPAGEAGVIAIFASRLLHGQDIQIYGDGRSTRDYVHIIDVCRAVSALHTYLPDMHGGIYNLGTGIETDVNQIAALVQKAVGVSGKAVHTEAVHGELQRSAIDARRLAHAIGWHPSVRLEDGIQATVDWFKAQQ